MATVLLCHDERLDRRVAVKRLHADSPRDVERRFLREAKLGASMNHPGLVSVYDTETDDEGLLIVMEHVDGESLAEALRRGPFPRGRVIQLARELGDALDHVHAQGVVHRDVKPANVLLRHDGAVKLADLGIAVSVDQTRMTRSGTVLGSAAYMAPEQLEGGEVGPPADIYALAAVCFEALAGRKPREGRTPMEIAHNIATGPPPDLREHAPELPGAAEVLARGMAREPGARPRSAGALAAELAGALEGGAARRRQAGDPTAPTRTVTLAAELAGVGASMAGNPAAGRAPTARAPFAAEPVRRSPGGRRSFAGPIAVLLTALAAVAVVAAVLLARDGGDGARQADRPAQRQAADRGQGQASAGTGAVETDSDAPDTTSSDTAPTDTPAAESPATFDPARGAALNDQGFALMGQDDFAGAVPILRKAVASWPENSTDLEYAYALYNLGASLNRSGHAAEAIPYLEKRLNWPNQRGVVKKELKLARRNARG
jgi:tetratricopeptide (TPR) repeat protein